jgi:triphosphatase
MGREFEMKYAATKADLEILKGRYPNLHPIAMETTYYDNAQGDFSRLRWTFRRRMENEKSICTLKTPAGGWGRAEFEVECPEIMESVPLLRKVGAPAQLLLLTEQGVQPSCGAKFTRLAKTLELEACTVELALDRGCLMGGSREEPLCEVEVEFKDGSEEAAAAFAGQLAEAFGLTAEQRSKYSRALALAQK